MTTREVIETLFEAFARRDAAVMVSLLADDVEWTQADGFPYAGTYMGPRAVLDQVWRRMGTEWLDWQAIPESIIVEGDRAVAVGTYMGVYKATDVPIRARFAHVYEVRESKIVRMEHFAEVLKVAAATQPR